MTYRWPWVFLAVGIGGLGFYGQSKVAPKIQQKVSSQTTLATTQATRHGATFTVSGRDIIVEGLLHDTSERDALHDTLSMVQGRRYVNMDAITLLPVASPYIATILKTDQGVSVEASLPDQKTINTVSSTLGTNVALEATMASGMPDAEWSNQIANSMALLDQMETASLTIQNTTVTLSGKAKTRDAKDALSAFQSFLPSGYELDLAQVEYPIPYNYTLSKNADGVVSLSGIAPEGFDVAALSAVSNITDITTDTLETTADGSIQDVEPALARIATVLEDLKTYNITFSQLDENIVTLKAVASPNIDLEAFEAKRAAANIDAGDIEMPRPFDVQFKLDALTGAELVGLAPEGFDAQQIATNLGLPEINLDNFEVGGRGDSVELSDQISNLKPVLEDVETLELGLEGTEGASPEVKAATLPNADPARVSGFLKEIFVSLTDLEVAPTTNVYTDGQERVNGITGIKEQYQAGYWIPLVAVTDPSAAGCKRITDDILAKRQIEFESGLALLDASARVVINRLTGVVSSCLAQSEMLVELAGHTDSDGDPSQNLQLSIRRVDAVRDALVTRGITLSRIQTVGYGQTKPIADNATPDGRKANRRTEVDWLE